MVLRSILRNAAQNAVDPDTYRAIPGQFAKLPVVVWAALKATWRKVTGWFR